MAHVTRESKVRLVVRSSMHTWPGNWVVISRAVVNYALAAHAFSAEIKCWHCISNNSFLMFLQKCSSGSMMLLIII